jgi:hypothetical protein
MSSSSTSETVNILNNKSPEGGSGNSVNCRQTDNLQRIAAYS